MKALLLIQTSRGGYIVVEAATIPEVNLDQVRCFESLGGRWSHGGVIDAVVEHFEPKPEAELKAVA